MKVTLSIKADEIRSSMTVVLTLDPSLYSVACARINELSVELKKLHDEIEKESV